MPTSWECVEANLYRYAKIAPQVFVCVCVIWLIGKGMSSPAKIKYALHFAIGWGAENMARSIGSGVFSAFYVYAISVGDGESLATCCGSINYSNEDLPGLD